MNNCVYYEFRFNIISERKCHLASSYSLIHPWYLCASPVDHAKIEAMLFVLVSPPFWWTL